MHKRFDDLFSALMLAAAVDCIALAELRRFGKALNISREEMVAAFIEAIKY